VQYQANPAWGSSLDAARMRRIYDAYSG